MSSNTSSQTRTGGLQVLGAGYGRTGTLTLKSALEILGYGPCYHMVQVFENKADDVQVWTDAMDKKPVDWKTFFDGYGAAVDFPAIVEVDELARTFPNAKIILTVRSPESWYQSASETIFLDLKGWSRIVLAFFIPSIRRIAIMHQKMVHREPLNDQLDKENAMRNFVAHNERIKRAFPSSSRLLIYEVKQGWEPLCAFLGVPVPSVPFPHLNDTAHFKQRIRIMRAIAGGLVIAVVGSTYLASRYIPAAPTVVALLVGIPFVSSLPQWF